MMNQRRGAVRRMVEHVKKLLYSHGPIVVIIGMACLMAVLGLFGTASEGELHPHVDLGTHGSCLYVNSDMYDAVYFECIDNPVGRELTERIKVDCSAKAVQYVLDYCCDGYDGLICG